MFHFSLAKILSFKKKLKEKPPLKSWRGKDLFSLYSLRCKKSDFSKNVWNYTQSLPCEFLKDQYSPSLFSYSWLQRLGRMDIFVEKMESVSGNEQSFSNLDTVKSDPIFRLPRKKKEKLFKKVVSLAFGTKKEEKIIRFQNKGNFEKSSLIKPNQTKTKPFSGELKKATLSILEIYFFYLTPLIKFSLSMTLITLGFFIKYFK
mmetsp:Transcript_48814/g.97731  ORF Transcript_48814/g.97731 Transcript_48814/m.97731 type:complete len:203 (+) Transcript_48814:3373-3981(+)